MLRQDTLTARVSAELRSSGATVSADSPTRHEKLARSAVDTVNTRAPEPEPAVPLAAAVRASERSWRAADQADSPAFRPAGDARRDARPVRSAGIAEYGDGIGERGSDSGALVEQVLRARTSDWGTTVPQADGHALQPYSEWRAPMWQTFAPLPGFQRAEGRRARERQRRLAAASGAPWLVGGYSAWSGKRAGGPAPQPPPLPRFSAMDSARTNGTRLPSPDSQTKQGFTRYRMQMERLFAQPAQARCV